MDFNKAISIQKLGGVLMVNIDILSNMFKIKYNILDEKMTGSCGQKNKVLLTINIGKILDTIYNIINKKSVIITDKMKVKILVNLLNIIAHYRHYYFSQLKCSNTILIYCDSQRQYNEYNHILHDLKLIIDFIPSVILIPKIDFPKQTSDNLSINPYFYYIHFVAYIIEITKKRTELNGRELIVNILANTPLEYQFLSICSRTYYLDPYNDIKIKDYIDLWTQILGKEDRISDKTNSLELKYLLLPYMMCYKRMHTGYPEKYNMNMAKIMNYKHRADIIFDTIDKSRGQSVNDLLKRFILNIYGDPKEVTSFLKKDFVFFFNTFPHIKPLLKELMQAWGKKLKDSKIHNINEFIKGFDENNLNINWLMEQDKGE
jgi:hypothetical protein